VVCHRTWLIGSLRHSKFLAFCPNAGHQTSLLLVFKSFFPFTTGVCVFSIQKYCITEFLCVVAGFSRHVIEDRNKLILSQIEAHAPNKESYTLIAKVVNVGVALLVYGRDDGVARYVTDVETTWTGCGPLYLGNKGAVGVRFRIKGPDRTVGETYTYVRNVCFF
jgi:hypothetical protein